MKNCSFLLIERTFEDEDGTLLKLVGRKKTCAIDYSTVVLPSRSLSCYEDARTVREKYPVNWRKRDFLFINNVLEPCSHVKIVHRPSTSFEIRTDYSVAVIHLFIVC